MNCSTVDKTLLPKGVEIADNDWQRVPQSVIALILLLLKTIEELTARLQLDSATSNRPPSTDKPFAKKNRGAKPETSGKGKPGARKGHKGYRQALLEATDITPVHPGPCTCGGVEFRDLELYYTHQYIELPKIVLPVRHFILFKGRCAACGKIGKGYVPHEYRYGFGPRFTALAAEVAGIAGNSRDTIRAFCSSVLGVRISLGTIQKLIDRAAAATLPHYEAIRDKARCAPVNHLDETSWKNGGKLHWLWVMVGPLVAFFMIHPNRSQKAFAELIGYWNGILVSDNYAVYRKWTNLRQTCLAHLIRQAKALALRKDPELAACGKWARDELQRLCKMAHEPPSRGEWSAFFARFCRLIDLYRDSESDAGKLVRLLEKEMECLFIFLQETGVQPTNNVAERTIRFAVLWRKRSFGSNSDKGCRWVERILSLRQTCRLHNKPTFHVLVDALTAHVRGHAPDISWIAAL